MSNFSGFKHTTFKASVFNPSGAPCYKGRAICYDDGRRLWQKTSEIVRLSRGDALRDAQQISHDHIIQQFKAGK